MNNILLWFYYSCKRQLKRPLFLILLCLLPLGVWSFHSAESKDSGQIPIALVTGESLWNRQAADLLLENQDSFKFFLCDTREELERQVMTRKAECGYIFPEDLKNKFENGNERRSITIVKSPSTVADTLSSETVFAALFQIYGRELLSQYSQEGPVFESLDRTTIFKELEPLYDKYLKNGSTFSFQYETTAGAPLEKPSAKATFPVKGIIAVFLFVMSLFAAVTAGEDEKNGLFKTVPGKKSCYMLAEIAAPVFFASISALICLSVSGEMTQPLQESVSIIIYALYITIIAFLLLKLTGNPLILAGLIPFFIIASLIACPIFADLSIFVPPLKTIRIFLPPYHYLVL